MFWLELHPSLIHSSPYQEVAVTALNDLIVSVALIMLRSVMALGTGLVYLQMFILAIAVSMILTFSLALLVVGAKALLG